MKIAKPKSELQQITRESDSLTRSVDEAGICCSLCG